MNGLNISQRYLIHAVLLIVVLMVLWPAVLQAQYTPTLQQPLNDSRDISLTPILYWNPPTCASLYDLEVSTNSNFATLVYHNENITTTSYQLTTPLIAYTIYYWRVRSFCPRATARWSDYSEVWSFRTVPPPPLMPVLVSPTNGQKNVGVEMSLDWNSPDWSSYQLSTWAWDVWIDDDATFSSPFLTTTDLNTNQYRVITGLARNTTYYWRIRARNGGGATYSETKSFTTVPNLPAAVTLLSPKCDSEVLTLRPEFQWQAVSDATNYQIYIEVCSNPATGRTYTTTTASWTPSSDLLKSTEYCWKVRAGNSGGWGGWSDIWSFTTAGDFTLSLTKAGSGQGDVKINSNVSALPWSVTALKGTDYSLKAIPAAGSVFAGWSGDVTSTNELIYLTLNEDKNVILTFNLSGAGHTVTMPSVPSGPGSGSTGETLTFITGGSTCSNGDAVQYCFDFGDGVISNWGMSSASHSFSVAGSYQVKAQARCAVSTEHVSAWSGIKNVEITSPSGGGVPIYPYCSTTQVGSSGEFTIDVKVGSASAPVQNLFGLSFTINYTPTNYLDVLDPASMNITPGTFLGTNLIFFQNLDDANGKLDVAMSRKSGAGGVNGMGSVLSVKFLSVNNPPTLTSLNFSVSNITANDEAGNPLQLTPQNLTLTVSSGARVWPGDNNNDGIVNQADVLPLGLYWAMTGPQRSSPTINWKEQLCAFWTNRNATYADANGDGVINQADLLPVGLNWAKAHTVAQLAECPPAIVVAKVETMPNLQLIIVGSANPNQDFFIDVKVNDVTNLFGLSFELVYSPAVFIDPSLVEMGAVNLMGNDLVFFSMINKAAGIDSGRISVGITRKAGQGGVSGTGVICRITAHMSASATKNLSHSFFTLTKIQANDAAGNPIKIDSTAYNLISQIDEELGIIPVNFSLQGNYPNPFNSMTTINWEIPADGNVNLAIYSVSGQLVRCLVHGSLPSGRHSTVWNGRDDEGMIVPSGVYICSLQAGLMRATKRITLLK